MEKKKSVVEVDEDPDYGIWLRPTRMTLNKKKSDTDNKRSPPPLRRQRTPSSTSTASSSSSGQGKRNFPSMERDVLSEFQSPSKRVKLTMAAAAAAGSPEAKCLAYRMTTRESEDSPTRRQGDSPLLNQYLPGISSGILNITPTRLKFGQRQALLPAPDPISPSEFLSSPKKSRIPGSGRKLILEPESTEIQKQPRWTKRLCLDWSLKTNLRIESYLPFGWTSTQLKASEESSGTSAFARCVDISTRRGVGDSQLDTSLGAQFHSACLYWQHPHIPSVNLFPRLGKAESVNLNNSQSMFSGLSTGGGRLDDEILNSVKLEWIDSFRSCFHLLRSRQCPYFYVCGHEFTALFAAAGIQGDERTQIYVNPTTRGFREALRKEGINFTLPYSSGKSSSETDLLKTSDGDVGKVSESGKAASASSTIDIDDHSSENMPESKKMGKALDHESDDEADKWLDDMGISQDVTVTSFRSNSFNMDDTAEDAKKSLVFIVGTCDSLSFFNFLLNSKQFLVSSGGNRQGGIPPTILSPVAFHGATLKSLNVKKGKAPGSGRGMNNVIELSGPILPQVIHKLTALLSSTVENYSIGITTLKHTIPLNLYSNMKFNAEKLRPAAFELQNLSDCGLHPNILEIFCKCGNCDTMKTRLECKDELFQWT